MSAVASISQSDRADAGHAPTLTIRQALVNGRLALACAVLWGIAVTTLESLGALSMQSSGAEAVAFMAALLLLWTSRALLLAVTAQCIEGRLGRPAAVSLFAAEAVVLALAWDGTAAISRLSLEWLALPLPLHGNFVYNLWILVAYGGPLFWFCLLAQRARRTRSVLDRAAVERSRTAAMVDDARFEALRGRIEPDLIVHALAALRARYAGDRQAAERLLDDLVAFLRSAMPGVRTGRSTLLTELALLSAHARLLGHLRTQPTGCIITHDGQAQDVPFPALLLVPLIERLSAMQLPPGEPIRIRLTNETDSVKLEVFAATREPGWLGPDLAHGLDSALLGLYGRAVRWYATDTPSLTLHLPCPTPIHPEGAPTHA